MKIAVSRAAGAEREVYAGAYGGAWAQHWLPGRGRRVAILAVATAPLTLIAGIAASSAVLVAVAIADTMGHSGEAPSMLG